MPTAFAIAQNTIVISRGIMETMTDEEIKGIIAHEFAHIAYGNTGATLLAVLGNSLFVWYLMIFRIILGAIQTALAEYKHNTYIIVIVKFLAMLFDTAITVYTFIGAFILNINSRANEFKADKYCLELGYGQNLIEALSKLDMLSLTGKRTVSEMVKATHPKIPVRIGRLEDELDKLLQSNMIM